MIASLPMYQRPQLVSAHNCYWSLIRHYLAETGQEAPASLSQDDQEEAAWLHPELVLSQTCGLPYCTRLRNSVNLVGTPDYAVDGCPSGYYCSVFVFRSDDTRNELQEFRDAVFAFNSEQSQSGFAAPLWHAKQLGFTFSNRLEAGQHLQSARAVAEGRADIAALDAVSWRLMLQHDAFTGKLRQLERTTPTPGLPYITGPGNDPEIVFQAVKKALADLPSEDRRALGIRDIVRIGEDAYLSVPEP